MITIDMDGTAGKILEHVIRHQEINISELSRKMNVSRRTIYNWFERGVLDKNLISTVGKIIGHDFSEELGADFNNDGQPPVDVQNHNFISSETNVSQTNETQYWMQKCIQLLEEYNQLLEKVNK